MEFDKTMNFKVEKEKNTRIKEVLKEVYDALTEKGYNPIVYRLFCLQSHYRKQLLFSYDALDQISNTYNKLLNKIKTIKGNLSGELNGDKIIYYQNNFTKALENDLNTSSAITVLYDVIKDEDLSNNSKIYLIGDFDKVLSLDLLNDKDNKEDSIDIELKKYIENKINLRKQAKEDKNYELADNIRKELASKGIYIKDTREGTIYEIKTINQ